MAESTEDTSNGSGKGAESKVIDGSEAPPPEPTLRVLLAQAIAPLLASSGAFGVLILSFGWSYAWHWFAFWEMPFSSLELGPNLLIEYGRYVILHFWWLAIGWLVALGVVAAFLQYKGTGSVYFVLLAVVGLLIPWLASDWLGKQRAHYDIESLAEQDFGTLPEVVVFLHKERVGDLPSSRIKTDGSVPYLCHRLIFRGKKGLWLVQLNEQAYPQETIFVGESAITYIRLRQAKGAAC